MNDLEKAAARSDENALRKELESAGTRFRGRACRCPFHDDHSPSAGIYFKNSVWKFKCQVCEVGGDIFDIRARLNKRTVGEELSGGRQSQRPIEKAKITYPTIAAAVKNFDVRGIHKYRKDDALHVVVVRFWKPLEKRKGILQVKPIPGGFVFGGPDAPHPLFGVDNVAASIQKRTESAQGAPSGALDGLEDVLRSSTPHIASYAGEPEPIFVVEGEAKAEALKALGFLVVTSLGGAGKASHSDWSPLAGQTVYTWADADHPSEAHPDGAGVEHMRDVHRLLATLSPAPRVYRIAHESLDLPEGGDAVDYLERLDGMETEDVKGAIRGLMASALPVGIVADYMRHMDEGVAGKRRPWQWPWPSLDASRSLTPGTVTVVCGDPKSGKSLLFTQCLVHWQAANTPACIYELEDGRNYHLARAHAQLSGNSGLLDPHWLENNPHAARVATETAMTELEAIGRVIWEPPPNECATYDMLLQWMEARAKEGFKIMIIDPITAARPEPKPWIADHAFIHGAKRIAEKYRVCPVIVIHPDKGHKGGGGGGNVAGGAAMSRFCHTLLWLDVLTEDAFTTVKDHQGMMADHRVNRSLRVVFARNGPGGNRKIAMHFDWRTMRFTDLGEIVG